MEFRLASPPFPNMESGGTSLVQLQGDKKSADYALFDATPGMHAIFRKYPTLVCEVAYAETSAKLAEDCGRWIACSLGRILLAVGLDITLKKKINKEDLPEISAVFCNFWELIGAERFDELPEGTLLDTLIRDDKFQKQAAEHTGYPPSSSFFCISLLGRQKSSSAEGGKPVYMKYCAEMTASHQVSSVSSLISYLSHIFSDCSASSKTEGHRNSAPSSIPQSSSGTRKFCRPLLAA